MFNRYSRIFGGSSTPNQSWGGKSPLGDLQDHTTSAQNPKDPIVNVPLSFFTQDNNGSNTSAKNEESTIRLTWGTSIAAIIFIGSIITTYNALSNSIKDIDHKVDNKVKDINFEIEKISGKFDNLDLKNVEKNINEVQSNIEKLNSDLSKYDIKSINQKLQKINQDIKDIKMKIEFNSENILSNKKDLNKIK